MGKRHPRFEVYPRTEVIGVKDREVQTRPSGEYGWRFRAANGQIQATSGEGFRDRTDAHRAIGDFLTAVSQPARDDDGILITHLAIDVDEHGDRILSE